MRFLEVIENIRIEKMCFLEVIEKVRNEKMRMLAQQPEAKVEPSRGGRRRRHAALR